MNEIEVPESSVLTYRLANGTHVLIHQSPQVLLDKGLEGGVWGVCLDGAEILQTQLLGHTTESYEPLNTEDDALSTEQMSKHDSEDMPREEEEEEEAAVIATQLETGREDLSLVTLTSLTTDLKHEEDEKEAQERAVTLEKLGDFVELVTSYKCRICPFTTPNQIELVQHFKLQHVQIKLNAISQQADAAEIPEATAVVPTPETLDSTNDVTVVNSVQPISEKLVYLCGQCNEEFASLEECKQHMMQDHDLIVYESAKTNELEKKPDPVSQEQELKVTTGESSAPSSTADTQETNPKSLVMGKRKVRIPQTLEKEYLLNKKQGKSPAANDKLKCSERGCQYKFSKKETLHMHMLCHGTLATDKANSLARKDFTCYVCGERFDKWRSCALHLWKAHELDADLLSCPICLVYKTVTAVKLETHLKIHGETRAYTCPECGKGFKQSSQLRNHRVMHLDRRVGPVPRWYASKRCDICFKSYADSKCLKKHIQAVHSKLRPYVCQVCGHASARKAMLQMHLRQHTGEKPYSCTLCEYRTGDHNSLRRHIMRHTGQRPYRCPHCDYSAIQTNSYKNHLRSKHPGMQGLYNCTKCPLRTVSQEAFLQHMSDHKNGLISSTPAEGEVEVFPENVAAAQLIYRSLNAFSADGSPLQVNVTSSATSEDGTTQTITIQIPTQQQDTGTELGDDETPHCFLAIQQEEEEEGVDTGGITIPAEPDPVPLLESS